jgi:hypothetical protein
MRSRGVRCQGARRKPVLGACWTAGRGTRTAASCLCCCSATAPPVPAGGSSLGCNSPRMRPPSNLSALHFAVRRIPSCHRRCFTMHAYSVSGPTKIASTCEIGPEEGCVCCRQDAWAKPAIARVVAGVTVRPLAAALKTRLLPGSGSGRAAGSGREL